MGTPLFRRAEACIRVHFILKAGLEVSADWANSQITENTLEPSAELRRRSRKLLYNSRYRAKRKGLEHNLTLEWIEERMEFGICALTGLPLSLDRPKGASRSPWSPSIDRKDSNEGYTTDNCQLVCTAVNTLKSAATLNDLLLVSMALLKRHHML